MVFEVRCPSSKGLSDEEQLATKAITPLAEKQMDLDA